MDAPRSIPGSYLAIPSVHPPSWQPRCELCAIARTDPEAYTWINTEILRGALTQVQICQEIEARFGLRVKQAQVSVHKTRHLLPDIQRAYDQVAALSAIAHLYGDVSPRELAEIAQKTALIQLSAELNRVGDATTKANLARTIGALGRNLQGLTREDLDAEGQALANQLDQIRLATEQGQLGEIVIAELTRRAPHLVPALVAAFADVEEKGSGPFSAAEKGPDPFSGPPEGEV